MYIVATLHMYRITGAFEQSAAQFAEHLKTDEVVNVTIPNQIVFAAENVI